MKSMGLIQVYSYRIALETAGDVRDFCSAASACRGEVYLTGNRLKINAKSLLGAHMARVAWNELYVEADFDCYHVFEKYIL